MTPVNLNELGGKLAEEVDFGHLPSQGGASGPTLPPGPYRFRLPTNLSTAHFDMVESKEHGQRIKVKFDDSCPLQIIQTVPALEKEWKGAPFKTSFSNVPRARGKEKILVSDMDYLMKALKVVPGPGVARTNRWFVEQLIAAAQKGAEFAADAEWGWSCNDQRDAYFLTATADEQAAPGFNLQTAELTLWELDPNAPDDQKNKKGCGQRYYQNEIQKVGGEFPLRIVCEGKDNQPCGAIVRAFPNLTRFRE